MSFIDQFFQLSDYQKNSILVSSIALFIATLSQGVEYGPIKIPALPSPYKVQSRVMAAVILLLFVLLHGRNNPENPLVAQCMLVAILFLTGYLVTSVIVYIFHPEVAFKQVNKISGIVALLVVILAWIPFNSSEEKPTDMTGLTRDTTESLQAPEQVEKKLTQSDRLLLEIEKKINELRQQPNDEALMAQIESHFLNDAEVVWYQNNVGFIQPDLNSFLAGIATRPYQIVVNKDKSQVTGNKIARIHLYGK